jgi:hypothetical protein
MPPFIILLGHAPHLSQERYHPDTFFANLRLEMGGCRLSHCVGISRTTASHILPFVQNQRAQPHHGYLLRAT